LPGDAAKERSATKTRTGSRIASARRGFTVILQGRDEGVGGVPTPSSVALTEHGVGIATRDVDGRVRGSGGHEIDGHAGGDDEKDGKGGSHK